MRSPVTGDVAQPVSAGVAVAAPNSRSASRRVSRPCRRRDAKASACGVCQGGGGDLVDRFQAARRKRRVSSLQW
jgi:hypothetical protein